MKRIPLTRPYITREIKDKVCETLDSGWLTEGPVTQEFEAVSADFIGCKHAIAATSCSTGLEIAMRCIGIVPGDEVIVPDYTFPCTAGVITLLGGTAVMVDIDRNNMLIDYDKLEDAVTDKTKAICPVSLFGNPLDYDRIKKIKTKHNLLVIEDAACGLGSSYCDRNTGTLADISVFSLHPRKTLTTGEGGMITTNNDEYASWIRSFKHFGMETRPDGMHIDMTGSNYKMSDINASVGLVMMKYLDELLEKRHSISKQYIEEFSGIPEIIIPSTTAGGIHALQSFTIFIKNRDAVLNQMRDKGIEVQIGTYALHQYKEFQNNRLYRLAADYSNSEYAFDHCLSLPMYHEMATDTVSEVAKEVMTVIRQNHDQAI